MKAEEVNGRRRARPQPSLFAGIALVLSTLSAFPILAALSGPASAGDHAAGAHWAHITRPGDTLIGLADDYLLKPGQWPVLQELNRVDNPRRLQPGQPLLIPVDMMKAVPIGAEVLMVNGDARVRSRQGDEAPVSAGSRLRIGDTLRVGAGSNLTLRFPDGSRLLVLEQSTLTLSKAVRLGKSDTYRIQIDLSEGSVDSRVTPLKQRPGQYEVRTPALRMAVRGTEFRASVGATQQLTRGEVLAGQVKMSGAGRERVLGKGFGTLAAPGEAPRASRPLPAAPDLRALPARLERLPLRFAWPPAAAAQRFRAQVFDAADALVLDGVFGEAGAKWASLGDGDYTLRVRAIGADGLEGVNASHRFTLAAQPEPPFASTPRDKGHGDSTRFSWSDAAGVVAYHFQLADDAEFSQLLLDLPALAATETTQPVALGPHFWRVASIDARGRQGPFGDVQRFEQKPMPASPQASSEIGDDKLTFRWQAGEPGQKYLLQLAKAADFSEIVFEQETGQAVIELARPDGGDYFMRVKAIDADGFAGPFGTTQRIAVPSRFPWWLLPLLLVPLAH